MKSYALYDVENIHYGFVTTIAGDREAKRPRRTLERRAWKAIAKGSPKLVQYFRENPFLIVMRPGGCWGNTDLG